ncbi:MAG: site-2 protease family protein [Eubacteriales bacterium]
MEQIIINKLLYLPGIIIALTFHEFAHAKAANLLGDPTPKQQGRVTLNPIAHMDIIGFIALMLVGFGWGKPVQINGNYFKHFKRDEIIVSLSGVTMNLMLAIIFAGVLKIMDITAYDFFANNVIGSYITTMVSGIVWINIVLMVFNIMPIPPLDGFTVIAELAHLREKGIYRQVYDKGPIILLLLIFFHITDKVIGPLANFFMDSILHIFF